MEFITLEKTREFAITYSKICMTERICKEMAGLGIKPKHLAKNMGISTKKLKKVLEDERKMTIEIFAAAMWALNIKVEEWLRA